MRTISIISVMLLIFATAWVHLIDPVFQQHSWGYSGTVSHQDYLLAALYQG